MSKPWVRMALLLFCVGWEANHFVALLLVYKATLALDAAALALRAPRPADGSRLAAPPWGSAGD